VISNKTEFEVLPPKKLNRHVVIALNHMKKRRDALNAQLAKLIEERDGIE
jgi:hypothetical protein